MWLVGESELPLEDMLSPGDLEVASDFTLGDGGESQAGKEDMVAAEPFVQRW